MRRAAILFGAFLAAVAVGAGAGIAVYAGVGTDDSKTVVREVTVSSAQPASRGPVDAAQVYQTAHKGVVEITVSLPEGQAQGSGWVYDSKGDVVTNDHVVDGASSITVTFADGSKHSATVVGTDPSTDLAVVKVDAPASELHPLALGDSSSLAVGDGVLAIGSPFGLDETLTSGIVSALDRTISSQSQFSISGAIQTDAAINHGNSGGPLLDLHGDVIGVNSQIESESGGNDGVGFAIPSNTVRSVAEQIIGGKKVEHAYLGVYVETPQNGSGARVARVTTNSPAADAGLKTGDVITAVDGHTIDGPDELTSAITQKQPADEVTVTLQRSGDTKTLKVTLGTRPS
jgi:putative serine protease PepD